MKLVICGIRDLAADAFMRPFFVPSVGVAQRMFGDEVARNADDNNMNRHPEHFVLFKLGEFDETSGEFKTHTPEQLALALDYKPADVGLRAVK